MLTSSMIVALTYSNIDLNLSTIYILSGDKFDKDDIMAAQKSALCIIFLFYQQLEHVYSKWVVECQNSE